MSSQVLFVELPGYKSLPAGESLRAVAGDAKVHIVSCPSAAHQTLISGHQYNVVVCNAPEIGIFNLIRQKMPDTQTVLVTELPMAVYSQALGGEEEKLLDHIIANWNRDGWTVFELRVTLNKILSGDIFGIEKYLAPGTRVIRLPIRGSQDREPYNALVMNFVKECGFSMHLAKTAFGITEELLMNAIYDAPVAAGSTHYAELPRSEPLTLLEKDQGILTYASDGRILVISAADPFGALKKDKLLRYLKKVLKRSDSQDLIDNKKGGAGLGLFKILYSSHGIICNVVPGKKTEMMAIIDTEEQLRDFSSTARSIHFFAGR